MSEMKVIIEDDDIVTFIVFKCFGASPDPPTEEIYRRYLTDEGKKAMKGITAEQGRYPGVCFRIVNAEYLTPPPEVK